MIVFLFLKFDEKGIRGVDGEVGENMVKHIGELSLFHISPCKKMAD